MENLDPALFSEKPAPDDSQLFSESPAPVEQSPLESAARGALRNFPMAQQAAAMAAPINPFSDKPTYGAELEHLTKKAEEGKAQNEKSYMTGAALGTLGPLAIPVAGEAMGAGEAALGAADIASGAGALGGGLNSAAQSLSDVNLNKPTPRELLEAGISGAGGAMLGKAFEASKAAAPIAKGVSEAAAPAVEEAAAPIAAAAAEKAAPKVAPAAAPGAEKVGGIAVPNKHVAPDFTPSAERIYASNVAQGFGGTPRQLMRIFGKEDPVKTLNEIGKWMESAGPGGKSLHGLLDRPGELLDKVTRIQEKSGEAIGDIIKKVSPEIADRELGAGVMADLMEFAQNTADPATEARINKLIATADKLDGKGVAPFEMLQQIKGMAGKQIAKDPEMSQVYGSLADRMTNLVNQHGATIKDAALKEVYDRAKQDYHYSSRILPMLRYAEARELVGGPAGHHTLRGLLSTIFNMAAGISGLPPVEQLAKNVQLKTAPAVRSIVNAGSKARMAAMPAASEAAKTAPGPGNNILTRAAQLELANALQSKFGNKKK